MPEAIYHDRWKSMRERGLRIVFSSHRSIQELPGPADLLLSKTEPKNQWKDSKRGKVETGDLEEMVQFVKDRTGVEVRTVLEVQLWMQWTLGFVMAALLFFWNWFPKGRQVLTEGVAISDSRMCRSISISGAIHSTLSTMYIQPDFDESKFGRKPIFYPNDVVLAKHKYNIINHSLVAVAVLVPIFFNEFCFQLLPLVAGFMNLGTSLPMYLFQGVDDKTIRFTHNGQVFFGKVGRESVYGVFRMQDVRPQAADPVGNDMIMDGTEITSLEVYEERITEPLST